MAIILEKVQVPHRKRWTREECRKLDAAGFLPGRYELIDGEIIEKMIQNPPHRITVLLLATWLQSVFGNLCVQTQAPIVLTHSGGNDMEPEPDAAVTREPGTVYQDDNPGAADLLLVCEVADSTLEYDLGAKAAIYAAAGIAEYWVLDVKARRLHIHRRPTADGYHATLICLETEEVSPLAHPEAVVAVAALLPPAPAGD
jgi:Uma2 family endonuclease